MRAFFLSEILPHPSKGNEEFIELGNQSGANVPLGGWTLRDSSKTGIYTFPKSSVLAAGSLFALFKSDFRFALNDSRETLTLSDAAGRKIHDAAWSTSKQGVSLNNVNGKFQGGTPTPGKPNQSNNLPRTSEKVPKEGFVGFPISFEAGGKDKETKKLKFTWDFGDGHKSYLEKTSHIYKKKGKYTVTLKTTDAQDDKIETFTVTIKAYKAPDIALVAPFPKPERQ
ncbi:MAG: PKD domain-containing protein [Candidatus Moraniibacteriota bacterium]